MNRDGRPEVFAFIDSQNLNVTVQNLGWKMDWKKFRRFLEEKFGVTKAIMFIGYVPENESLYESLHESGYSIVLKPTYDMSRPRPEQEEKEGSEEKKVVKGNVDADLVLWVMKEVGNYDKAVLVTGDGDFFSLIEYLIEKNKLLKLLTPSGHYSRLFNPFKEYIERLDQSRRQLEYKDRRFHSRKKQ